MANRNGKKYGFTALFPIKRGDHTAELRSHLRRLDCNFYGSPLSEVRAIHMARFAIIDRLAYQGLPAKADSLASSYLLFLCDFDGESPDTLVTGLLAAIPAQVEEIWKHCVAFPGIGLRDPLAAYFERCQFETNLFLADRPQDTVDDILQVTAIQKEIHRIHALAPAGGGADAGRSEATIDSDARQHRGETRAASGKSLRRPI